MILALLEKAPEERPQNAGDVQGALETMDVATPSAATAHHTPLERLARGVFVGRESEMTRLRRAFDNALGGHGELVMLVGEPGIGKTRTTLELETYARMRGAQVHWGRNHEGSGAPAFWPWIQVGRALGNAIGVGTDAAPLGGLGGNFDELVRLFPELREMLPNFQEPDEVADPDAAQFALFDAYAAFARGAAYIDPMLIVLDDLHWADKPSLMLLQHLARELASMRILILGTFRDTDLVRTHPLSETLATLNRESGFERIVLRGLSADEVRAYITSAANVELSRSVLSGIVEETEGNPFFLSEVVNLMAEEGTLSARSLSDIAIPDGVREALGRRLDRLSEEANALLQTASVVGREFPDDTLAALDPDGDDDALLRLIEEGLEARVIEEMDQPGRYRFTHHLMQETLLKELSTTRRVRVHGQIGEALERRFGARAEERASRLAQHFVEASTLSERHAGKAVRYSKLSAQQAEAQSAFAEAAAHYDNCLTVLSTADGASPEEEAPLLVSHGVAARNAGDNRAGYRSLMRAIDLYRGQDELSSLGSATIEVLGMFMPPDRAEVLLRGALAAGDRMEPGVEARLHMIGVRAAFLKGDEAAASRRRAAELAEEHDLPDVRAALKDRQATDLRIEGRYAEAAAAYADAADGYATLGRFGDAANALWNRGIVAVAFQGDLAAGRAANEGLLSFARDHGQRFFEEQAASNLGSILFLTGELDAFDALLERRAGDDTFVRNSLLVARAVAIGDLDGAEALLPSPEQAAGVPMWASMVHANHAQVACLRGDLPRLRAALTLTRDEAAKSSRDQEGPVASFVAVLDEALLTPEAKELGVLDEANRLMPEAAEPFGFGVNGSGSIQRIRAQLDEASGRDATAGYRAAMELSQQGAGMDEGRAALGLARLEQRRGNEAVALELATRAIPLLDRAQAPFYRDQAFALQMELRGLADVDVTASIDLVAASIETERPDLSTQTAPDGTVTLLFSDIENSTARTSELGDARWMELLRAHNAIVREALSANDGYEVKSMGDGFMLAFRSASDGVRCAIAMQQAFAEHNARAEQPIVVRIGLHTGEAIREADDFFGTHVNLAARVGGVANGGEILISGLLRELTAPSGEFGIGEGREVSLKGISAVQSVHAVEWR